ncbi:Translocator protein [Trichoplax sp. H2]|uniref:Peripheral-type benzodiazepine receptor n=1 Tax=Trichoplax adhaerens TaxID=10228 RepID=B3RRN2_TRIAD|nr:expressed hypothetical protein [Trichoplax adhaerens]EDV26381.1 expressed hypothetical protein [Trichoplax adhaerens]RDD39696.1 Translocator protein [Trichoplax sp. H2]|eukprot:XP_002110377.1 expressed hypothetical protein [Trichoplax adhaerens]
MSDWKKIVLAIAIPETVGFLGSYFTKKSINTWYKHIRKPSFTPPNWIFGPMWTLLYAGMGYASYLVWRDGGGFEGPALKALQAYELNLVFNGIWTPLFFGAKRMGLAGIDIVATWASIVYCIHLFTPINATAGKLMWPYLGWVSFASLLNFSMWYLNRNTPSIKED